MLQSSNKGLTICDFRFGRGGAKEACGLLVACWSRRAVVVLRNEDCLSPGVSHAMSPCPGYQNEVTIFDFGFGGGELRGSPGACGMLVQAHSFPYAKR